MARTVRVALWGGEEEGLYGSLAYVQQHFAPRETMKKTPEYDKLDVYFNDDSGSGKFRAVSALGDAQLAAIFQSWIAPIKDLGIEAVIGQTAGPTLQPGGTDSTSFSWIGLNGIGFMQDPLEYGTRSHPVMADPEVTRFGYLCMCGYLNLSERFLLRQLGEHLGDRRRRFCLRGSYFCDRTTCSIVQSTHRPCSPEQVIPAGELETIASTKFDTSG
jgi:Peptidase family M28